MLKLRSRRDLGLTCGPILDGFFERVRAPQYLPGGNAGGVCVRHFHLRKSFLFPRAHMDRPPGLL